MTLFDYLRDDGRLYRYVGTVWGPNSETEPGTYFAKIAGRRDSGTIVYTPYESGWYIHWNGSVTYRSNNIQETVLELAGGSTP